MHATMAIFNAWCDRVPMLILGATGPWDAARRRPWIDWIHTSSDQGALVRDYTKWDNQPASVPAAYEALLRAAQIANTAPRGPTYVNLDAAVQETKIGPLPPLPDVTRYRAPEAVLPKAELIDTAGALKQAWGDAPVGAKVILVSPDAHAHRGWSMDHQGLPPADVYLMCEPDAVVPLLLEAVEPRAAAAEQRRAEEKATDETLSLRALADQFNAATAGLNVCLARLPLGWNGAYRHFKHPFDYLGSDGGGGVGAGPGLIVGAALALKDSGRMVAGILGDGDFLMGVTALWTAAHYRIPCLFIVANNRSFYNDELHQERIAHERGRPIEHKWIGQRIDEPGIDLASMAGAQGAFGIGPVTDLAELKPSLERAVELVREGNVCVVDVRVVPGYDSSMSGSPARR